MRTAANIFVLFLTAFVTWRYVPAMNAVALDPDYYGYLRPAVSLAEDHEMRLIYARTFGYPLFLAGFLAFDIPWKYLAQVQGLLTCLTGALIYFTLDRASDRIFPNPGWRVFLGTRLMALWLAYTFWTYTQVFELAYGLRPEALTIFCAALATYCLADMCTGRRLWLNAVVIAACGAALLALKPSFFVFVGFMSLAAIIVAWRKGRPSARAGLGLIIVSLPLAAFVANGYWQSKYDAPTARKFVAGGLVCTYADMVRDYLREDARQRGSTPPADVRDARLLPVLDRYLALGPEGYPLQGFNGNTCFYNAEYGIFSTLDQNLKETSDYLLHLYFRAALDSPLRIVKRVGKQFLYSFVTPWIKDFGRDIKYDATGFLAGVDAEIARMNGHPGYFTDSMKKFVQSLHQAPLLTLDILPKILPPNRLLFTFALCLVGISMLFGRARENWLMVLALLFYVMSAGAMVAILVTFDVSRYIDNIVPCYLAATGIFLLLLAKSALPWVGTLRARMAR